MTVRELEIDDMILRELTEDIDATSRSFASKWLLEHTVLLAEDVKRLSIRDLHRVLTEASLRGLESLDNRNFVIEVRKRLGFPPTKLIPQAPKKPGKKNLKFEFDFVYVSLRTMLFLQLELRPIEVQFAVAVQRKLSVAVEHEVIEVLSMQASLDVVQYEQVVHPSVIVRWVILPESKECIETGSLDCAISYVEVEFKPSTFYAVVMYLLYICYWCGVNLLLLGGILFFCFDERLCLWKVFIT